MLIKANYYLRHALTVSYGTVDAGSCLCAHIHRPDIINTHNSHNLKTPSACSILCCYEEGTSDNCLSDSCQSHGWPPTLRPVSTCTSCWRMQCI